MLDEMALIQGLEACFWLGEPIFGTRIRVFHYATHCLRSRLVFTPPNRRKVRIDGLAQHDLPSAQAIDKQALDEVVRRTYQTWWIRT